MLVSSALSDLSAQNQHFPQAGFSDDYRMATCSNQGSGILYSDILGDRALSTRFEHKVMDRKLPRAQQLSPITRANETGPSLELCTLPVLSKPHGCFVIAEQSSC